MFVLNIFHISVLTHFCDIHDIRHINVMHGENYFLYVIHSLDFMNAMFGMSSISVSLINSKHSRPFIVSIPKSMKIKTSENSEILNDYTYYL
jgi:hypothetical protein